MDDSESTARIPCLRELIRRYTKYYFPQEDADTLYETNKEEYFKEKEKLIKSSRLYQGGSSEQD